MIKILCLLINPKTSSLWTGKINFVIIWMIPILKRFSRESREIKYKIWAPTDISLKFTRYVKKLKTNLILSFSRDLAPVARNESITSLRKLQRGKKISRLCSRTNSLLSRNKRKKLQLWDVSIWLWSFWSIHLGKTKILMIY